ncbi:uncharacterized protein LOC126793750 [Argentina anserina]|uniref:uncharacterized protein LOC126793750 n=1 Tax=Argentina anserina TaxID=57926 RepID=UPI0021763DC6|nr:uncharacterized protein LOC126793750 [Potentilla anserina]
MFVLASKLRTLKQWIRVWNKAEFGDVNIMVEKSFDDLHIIQREIASLGPSDDLLSKESVVSAQVHEALLLQEKFLWDKSRIKWLTEGDRKSSVFHAMVKVRHLKQSLSTMRDRNSIIDDPKEINDHVVNYFNGLFTSDSFIRDTGLVSQVIHNLVTTEDNAILTAISTSEEIFQTMCSMDHNSSPSPDDFGGIFFMKFPRADTVTQLRPIAMANFIFKLITKILADRLGSIATWIISPNQSAFLSGRTIADLINLLDRNCKGGNIAIKFDVQKTFDTLD